ncbi:MAG TPA: helix-turn-helix domain-containing protein [Streptosporangiaceae bacterium]|nr:helix-turn-helix domain-containing protein [Streptosporangiaceae bacterium]
MTRPWALDYDTAGCTIAAALAVVGEKWAFLVLREAFNGVRRFDDMQRRTGMPRQVLSSRLSRLVSDGILRKTPYQDEGQRPRSEYRLTDKGVELYPVMVALLGWGDKYVAQADGPPVELTHRDCGAPVQLQLACSAGHVLDSAKQVTPVPGPGARRVA